MRDMDYATALAKAPLLIELGDTTVYLSSDSDYPWGKATSVTTGGMHRLSGPASAWIEAEEAGITMKWSLDFEGRDANGRGVSLFDRERLRDVAMKLPPVVRSQFAAMMENEVLPGMVKRTREIREALNNQLDSEDCLRGIIAFAAEQSA